MAKQETKPILITDPELLNEEGNIKKVKRSIAEIKKGVAFLINSKGAVIIGNEESQINAIDIRSRVRKGRTIIEKEIKYYTDPLKKIVKGFTAFKDKLIVPLDVCDNVLRIGLVDYQNKLEAGKRKKEMELREKIRKEQEERDAEIAELQKKAEKAKSEKAKQEALENLDNKIQEPPVLPEDTTIEVDENIETDNATLSFRDNWKATIQDEQIAIESLIKNGMTEYLKIDESKLNKYAKIVTDTKEIAGVKFWNDKTAVQRDK